MNSKHIMTTIACAAAFCGSVRAEEANDTSKTNVAESAVQPSSDDLQSDGGWNWAMGEGITYDETPILSTEVGISFDSKYMTYGLVDNNDPIMTFSAGFTVFDWVSFGIDSIFDISRYGDDAGYGNRKFKYTENDIYASLCHSFGPDDVSWLPTTIDFDLGYTYEAHPRSMYYGICGDSQFITFEVGLPDLWFEPTFLYERDIMRDNGTYLNLSVGHTFALIDGDDEEDDPILSLRPSVAQGWGDARRIYAYLPDIHNEDFDGLDHQGLMDTCVRCDLEWNICDGVTLSGYVAYYDYLFDPSTREASRYYEATGTWDMSYNFVTGLALTVAF